MQCSDFYEIADSYLGDELLVETNHEVLQHLEGCAACRRELAARRELRTRLRAALYGAATPGAAPEFAGRLRAELRSKALGRSQARHLFFGRTGGWAAAAIAASLLVMVGFFALQQRRASTQPPAGVAANGEHAPHTSATENTGRREAWPQHQASPDVRKADFELSEAAAGDHRDCAIKFRLVEDPIDLEEAGHKYDRAYINLTSVVKTRSTDSTGQFEFIESHSCVFKGQRFAHIVIKHRGRVVSLVVAERGREQERAAGVTGSGQAAPPDDARREVIACSRSGEFQVSCFETARHAIFVVSDLSEAENLAVARAFAPSIQEHIARSENAA